jgi:hypothetical protein
MMARNGLIKKSKNHQINKKAANAAFLLAASESALKLKLEFKR